MISKAVIVSDLAHSRSYPEVVCFQGRQILVSRLQPSKDWWNGLKNGAKLERDLIETRHDSAVCQAGCYSCEDRSR